MKNLLKVFLSFAIIATSVPWLGQQPASAAASQADYSIAYINEFSGLCEIKKKGTSYFETVREIYVPLYQGDVVKTAKKAKAEVVFDDETIVQMDPESRLEIKTLARTGEKKTLLSLIKGRVFVIVKKLMNKEEFAVKTKMAMAAVKGTEFVVESEAESDANDKVGVYEGAVQVSTYDMDGKEREKIILDKDKETTIIKNVGRINKPSRLNTSFVKRYKEIKDLKSKIEYIREMRRSGKIKEYRLQNRLKRIENLKRMKADPAYYNSLDPQQKQLMDEMIKYQGVYQQELDREMGSKYKTHLKKILEKKKKERAEE